MEAERRGVQGRRARGGEPVSWTTDRETALGKVYGVMIPVIFFVLFVYLVDGAGSGSTGEYVHHIFPIGEGGDP